MSKDDDRLTEIHNQGQEDAGKNDYDPPHGIVEDLITWSSSGMDKICEENTAYKAGWENGKKNL
jgi:hypothetical protein